jgi:hypothetical protein
VKLSEEQAFELVCAALKSGALSLRWAGTDINPATAVASANSDAAYLLNLFDRLTGEVVLSNESTTWSYRLDQ